MPDPERKDESSETGLGISGGATVGLSVRTLHGSGAWLSFHLLPWSPANAIPINAHHQERQKRLEWRGDRLMRSDQMPLRFFLLLAALILLIAGFVLGLR